MAPRCVFCAANLPHAQHISVLEAAKLGIAIVDSAGTPLAASTATVTSVTPQPAPSAPQE